MKADLAPRASLPARWKRTQAGRIVYSRTKHEFSWRDSLRIARSVCIAQFYDPFTWNPENKALAEGIIDRVKITLEAMEQHEDEFHGFHGGEFGGGGGTRPFKRK